MPKIIGGIEYSVNVIRLIHLPLRKIVAWTIAKYFLAIIIIIIEGNGHHFLFIREEDHVFIQYSVP